MVKLKHLTESLNSKYLTEAFGDTFPKWFKDALADSRKYYGKRNLSWNDRHGGAIDVGIDPSKAKGPKPSVKFPKGYQGDESSLSLFNLSRQAGLDFHNTNIIESPIPSPKDPILSDTSKIKIWGFPNGQVYVEGINDRERYLGEAKPHAFSSLSVKKLTELANHFAYFDASELDPHVYYDKEKERNKTFSDMISMYYDHPEMVNTNRSSDSHFAKLGRMDLEARAKMKSGTYAKDKLDKSGYLVSPKRYEDALKKAKAGRVLTELEKIHRRLKNLYAVYIDALDNIDDTDLQSVEEEFPLDAMRVFRKLTNSYNSLALEASLIDKLEGEDRQNQLVKLQKAMNEVRWDDEMKYIESHLLQSVDWLI